MGIAHSLLRPPVPEFTPLFFVFIIFYCIIFLYFFLTPNSPVTVKSHQMEYIKSILEGRVNHNA